MKLKASEIREPVEVEIRGDESWLSLIYESFQLKKGPVDRRLTGNLKITPEEYGVYTLTGRLSYTPKVSCGRCEDQIDWAIEREINARFLTPVKAEDLGIEEDEDFETDLEPEDLDSYYLDNGWIDVEQVINDLVQTALPQRLVKTTADGKACAVCLVDLQDRLVYQDETAKEANPFAVLKNLKLPQD